MEASSQLQPLSKPQIDSYFAKIFQNDSNTLCFECNKRSKQWADKSHAIFLCLGCAALYKEIKGTVEIRSVGLDLWNEKDLTDLMRGGNARFRQYLKAYDLRQMTLKDKLKSRAYTYYRQLLKQESNGRALEIGPPSPQEGILVAKQNQSITEMSPGQILDEAKEKAIWLGGKTKQLGSKAIDKVGNKISSGELKQDVKQAAKKAGAKAKDLWKFVKGKVSELTGKQASSQGTKLNENQEQPL